MRIERTRQLGTSSRKEPAAFTPTVAMPRGVLQSSTFHGSGFFHQRLAPSPGLATWIQHYWMVQWDLLGAGPSIQETLPHPNCYLLFEQDLEKAASHLKRAKDAEIAGVCTGKFTRRLEGFGRVFGVKFRPGGLRPWLGGSASTLTDRVVPAESIFGRRVFSLTSMLCRLEDAEAMAKATSEFFAARLPAPDPSMNLSAELVEVVLNDPLILTVEGLAHRAGMSVRSLQRLFKNYVGVSPKWVIRRYRLHELVERFHAGEWFDGAQLALDLGYADQAHLINDFRKLVGYTLTKYRDRFLQANRDFSGSCEPLLKLGRGRSHLSHP